MSRNVRNIMIGLGIAAALALIGAMSLLSRRIPMNPEGTVGNTAGNLHNSGLVCEYEGTVYFANAYDDDTLYAMNPDESNVRKLNSAVLYNLLAGGSFLYYFQLDSSGATGFGSVRNPRSFVRCDLNGQNAVGMTRDVVVTAQLAGNYLYILTPGDKQPYFYKLKIDKSEEVRLADFVVDPSSVQDGVIYYNGTQGDHSLYALNTAADTVSTVLDYELWNPVVEGDFVYFMDILNNYRLCRYSFSEDAICVLTEDRVDCFNVGSGYIYYQRNGSDAALVCMETDGSNPRVIAEGNFTKINMTSQYVYFRAFETDTLCYRTALGSGSYGEFTAAREAALSARTK